MGELEGQDAGSESAVQLEDGRPAPVDGQPASADDSGTLSRVRDFILPQPIDDVAAQAETRKDSLNMRLSSLAEQRKRYLGQSMARFRWAALALLLIIPLAAITHSNRLVSIAVAYGLAFVFFGVLSRSRAHSFEEDIVDVRNELDLLELAEGTGEQREQRATKMLQVSQVALKRYYDQTLRQGAQIFFVGLICIVLGFAVIGVSFWLIQSDRLDGLSAKIVVAALGAVSGILADYIAVVYLKMFSETIQSVSKFHGRLVERDRLGLGNVLVAKIDTAETRERALREMAVALANGQPLGDAADGGAPTEEATAG